MNIQKYIKECYEIAQSKGFYPEDSKIEDHLMGIVSEIGEAYEAHRGGNICNPVWFEKAKNMLNGKPDFMYSEWYKERISGTFEDELADVFIRLFNLCGHYGIKLDVGHFVWEEEKNFNVSKNLFECDGILHDYMDDPTDCHLEVFYDKLIYVCNGLNIPIEKHIQAKIEYNKTREHLHGKEY